jgi:hypothetical protein
MGTSGTAIRVISETPYLREDWNLRHTAFLKPLLNAEDIACALARGAPEWLVVLD